MNDQEKLRHFASLLIAKADGKTIESHLMPGKWYECDLSHQTWHAAELFRIKPEPKIEYWSRPEHVPGPVCWIRKKNGVNYNVGESTPLTDMKTEAMIVSVSTRGFTYMAGEYHLLWWAETDMLSALEHSTDRITWQPCTVKEAR